MDNHMALAGLRVLVVEDELLVALSLEATLVSWGCTVLGPYAGLNAAARAAAEDDYDLALLDINLRGQPIFPLAAQVCARGVPILFCTGYSDSTGTPPEFRSTPRLLKPYDETALLNALRGASGGAGVGLGRGHAVSPGSLAGRKGIHPAA